MTPPNSGTSVDFQNKGVVIMKSFIKVSLLVIATSAGLSFAGGGNGRPKEKNSTDRLGGGIGRGADGNKTVRGTSGNGN